MKKKKEMWLERGEGRGKRQVEEKKNVRNWVVNLQSCQKFILQDFNLYAQTLTY